MQVNDRMSLSTTNQLLTVTADDIVLTRKAAVSSGTAAIRLSTETATNIGLGSTPTISSNEMALITATGFTIGSVGVNKHITVAGIQDIHSTHITKVVTIVTTVDDSHVTLS